MRSLRVGHALADGTTSARSSSPDQLEQDLGLPRGSVATRAPSSCIGGERLERDTDGYFLEPALFVSTSNDMRVNREEIFGPIATVVTAADADEALALANDTRVRAVGRRVHDVARARGAVPGRAARPAS